MKDPLLITDICGTLYKSNTTYDFYRYYFSKHHKVKYIYFMLLMSLPAKVLYVLLSKSGLSLQKLRYYLIGLIENESVEKVEVTAKIFFEQYLKKRVIPETEVLIMQSNRLIFSSASVAPVVSLIAEKYNAMAYFATTLEVKNGKYTGKILQDNQGKKAKHLLASDWSSQIKNATFITDNKEDVDLLRRVERPIVVSASKELSFWKKTEIPALEIILK
ncbi:haloacid dehalogenase-like hydrolase [Cecembia calidifontis]|nr:haloacid dehalogenase-like hydrolase [Cecembia calidifontis]